MAQPKSIPDVQSLQRIALFGNLSPDILGRIQKRCSWRRYEPREVIIDYLDPSDEVYFIIDGAAHVTIYSSAGKEVIFRDLDPGQVFGEYAAIDRRARSANVEARPEGCLAASMSANEFRELYRSEPKFAEALLEHLVKELRELTRRVYEFSTLCVNNRIQAELLRMARRVTPAGTGNEAAIPKPSEAEIASRISTHREAVSREISHLSKKGIIKRQDHAILVGDIEALEEMVRKATSE